MPIHHFTSNFLAGEVSPQVHSRVDLERYPNALETLENFIVKPTGGGYRRDGTRYISGVANTQYLTNPVRLVPFEYSETEPFILEFGYYYIRFLHHGQLIKQDAGVEHLLEPTFAVNPPVAWEDASTGTGSTQYHVADQHMHLNGGTAGRGKIIQHIITAMTIGNQYVLRFEVVDENPIDVSVGSIGSGATDIMDHTTFGKGSWQITFRTLMVNPYVGFSNAGNYQSTVDNASIHPAVAYSLTTTYTWEQIFELQFYAYQGILYITHPSHPPRALTRTADESWAIAVCSFVDGPYLPEESAAITAASTTGLNVQFTATTDVWLSTMVGSLMRFHSSGEWGYGKMVAYETARHVHFDILGTMPSTTLTKYREGCWSYGRGWPKSLCFYEGRMIIGPTVYQPQTVWGSKVGVPLDFKEGSLDDRSFAFTLACRSGNMIQWLASENRELIAGTLAGPVRIVGGQDNPISPTNVKTDQATSHSCFWYQPLEVDNHLIYQQRSQQKLRALIYSWQDNVYKASDITRGAEHITESGIQDYCYQDEPDQILWVVRVDGTLVGFTYDREDNIYAWHEHPTNGYVESCACVHSPTGKRDDVYLVVRRTINGVVTKCIEIMTPDAQTDCSVIHTPVWANIAYNFTHLPNTEIQVKLDTGEYVGTKTVGAGGTFALTTARLWCDGGLAYTSTAKSLPPEFVLAGGSTRGKKKRWVTAGVDLLEAVNVTIDGITVTPGTFLVPYTGWQDIIDVGWDRRKTPTIVQSLPYRLNILGIGGDIEIS
jgi:hypothetical protein